MIIVKFSKKYIILNLNFTNKINKINLKNCLNNKYRIILIIYKAKLINYLKLMKIIK